MNEKKKATPNNKPEHIVRRGEVLVTVNLRQANTGYTYYDLSVGRSWMSRAASKELHGSSFFESHEEQLVQAIREASAWIREKQRANTTPNDAGTTGPTS